MKIKAVNRRIRRRSDGRNGRPGRFTPNLYKLKYDLMYFRQNTATSIQKNEEFYHISDVNKVKRLDIRETCTLKEIKMLVNLFPHPDPTERHVNDRKRL